MELKDLKKKDLIEYEYEFREDDVLKIKRDIVSMVVSNGTIVIGGVFSFDYKRFKILKLWREVDSGEYALVYKNEEKDENGLKDDII